MDQRQRVVVAARLIEMEAQALGAENDSYLTDAMRPKCGRGLAPDGGGSVTDVLIDTTSSGASRIVAPPLPQWDVIAC